MSFSQLILERKGKIAWLTLNRPQQLNAMGRRMVEELDRALTQIEEDDQVQVLAITGAGEKAFAAGADIQEMAEMDPQEAKAFSDLGQRVFRHLEGMRKPSLAAINGLALGAGCELAISCSLRIASESARLGQPEVNLGIIPGWGGTCRLPRLIGRGRALYLILRGEIVDAQEAWRIGLVDKVVPPPDLLPLVEEVAQDLLRKGPLALGAALEAILRGEDLALPDAN
ncbi:MAG: enoyl-CoA hydratase-related protein, partial [candidate division NC10 bacterium]|nr:enoyl-CoA hydratase-related protein [candidate division NC10 bacterium]